MQEPVVLDEAASDEVLLAGGPGDRGRAGVGLQGSGVGEPCPVVADLGEQPGSEQGAEAGEAEQDLAVGVLLERGFGGRGEVVRGLAGGIQLLEEGKELVVEGVLDSWELAGVLGAEDAPQTLGFAVEGTSAATALEGGSQLGEGQFRGPRRSGARARMTRASGRVRPSSLHWKACRAAG